MIGGDYATHGMFVGYFAPSFKLVAEAWREFDRVLHPIKRFATRDGVYTTVTHGRIDFWSLENPNAGRSRGYHLVIIDEAAFTKNGEMLDTWRRSIEPTLADYGGRVLVASNTNGEDPENFLHQCVHMPELGFREFHAPTRDNPHLSQEFLQGLKERTHPLVYSQEYEAQFVDWSGAAFFAKDKLLLDGGPVPDPARCDYVFAVIDSATKTGTEHDGTGCIYFAFMQHSADSWNLVILDWELFQIEGALLDTWLPTVFGNLEAMAQRYGAQMGSAGAFIEDKSSGMVLLQQAQRRGWPATPIESKLTSVGKDERAISVSGYVYREQVKLTRTALDKMSTYKGSTRNHLLGQVVGFRVGDKDARKREDDLLDDFCYGIALSMGNEGGF
jgi:hypothetical protein